MNCQMAKSPNGQAIELLSPARDLECGIAAIDHGADAVYIGAPRFGARAAAGNSVHDIGQLCDYAHRFGARIYVTLNTLLYPEEREPARLLAWELHRAGADALIVQDTVFLGMDLPPIPLHASTQMDNRTPDKVAWLHTHGYSQIVLARELTLDEIRGIHRAVPEARLEAFVHGALCVSYSGRCYASEYCFGRSANRGECAQFCRLPFSLQDADGGTLIGEKYLLSLRDMNRSAHLEEMMDAGVRSFKIEGRLKDIAYVKNVTAAYRQAIDGIMRRRPEYVRPSFGTSAYTFRPDLSRSFSRGSTDYFLFGRTDDLASPDTPKSRGREVGRVKEVRRDCIIVSSTEAFSNGDGICFFDAAGRLRGFRVNRAEGNHLYPASMPSVRKGDRLWRSFDQQWERQMEGQTAERRIGARFLLEETAQGFRLTFSADDGTRRSLEFPSEHQPARTDQTASITEVLGKLGDTPYLCTEVDIRFSMPWFIPKSTLAEWRRNVIRHSTPLPLQTPPKEKTPLNLPLKGKTPSNSPLKGETPLNLPLKGRLFSLPLREGWEGSQADPLMTCRFCLRHAWGQCKKASRPPVGDVSLCGTKREDRWKEPLSLVLADGRRFRLGFDCKRCEMKVHKP